jgi:hypothetical protein
LPTFQSRIPEARPTNHMFRKHEKRPTWFAAVEQRRNTFAWNPP